MSNKNLGTLLPQEKNLTVSEEELPNGLLIEVSLPLNFFNNVKDYDDLLQAFKLHYNNETGGENRCYQTSPPLERILFIPRVKPKIIFEMDYGKYEFRFRICKKDKRAKNIVYSFIQLMQRD